MRRALVLGLMVLSGCDILPAKDRSVVLRGTVVDAQTGRPIGGMRWVVYTVRGWATDPLAAGTTGADGRFEARYEHPCCSDATFEASGASSLGYKSYAQQVYGMGKTIEVTARLEKMQ